jgi:hypothetical protein
MMHTARPPARHKEVAQGRCAMAKRHDVSRTDHSAVRVIAWPRDGVACKRSELTQSDVMVRRDATTGRVARSKDHLPAAGCA